MQKIKKQFPKLFLAAFCIVTLFIWYAVFYFQSQGENLSVTFFDVGQGDSIFVQADNGAQVLIDGGPNNSVLSKLGKIMPFWDHSIDVVILTHPHADHLDGLVEVLRRYSVDTVLETEVNHSIPEYSEWHQLLKEKNVNVVLAKKGQRIKLSDSAYLDILTPFEDFTNKSLKNIHSAMIVSKLTYGSTAALFMGDAERPLEYQLLFSGIRLKSDILKVGHHGSKTSSSEDFLEAVSPRFAVIFVGKKNRYGHPTQEVLDRLAALGIDILRTDNEGNLTFISDGGKLWRE